MFSEDKYSDYGSAIIIAIVSPTMYIIRSVVVAAFDSVGAVDDVASILEFL